jgi:hypothetical protein
MHFYSNFYASYKSERHQTQLENKNIFDILFYTTFYSLYSLELNLSENFNLSRNIRIFH